MQICYIPYKNEYEVYAERKLNKEFGKIKNSKTRAEVAACLLAVVATKVTTLAQEIDPLEYNGLQIEFIKSNLDVLGKELLGLIQHIGFWVAIGLAAFQIVKQLYKQDLSGIVAIIIQYSIAYGSLHFLPWLFKLIAGMFSMPI